VFVGVVVWVIINSRVSDRKTISTSICRKAIRFSQFEFPVVGEG